MEEATMPKNKTQGIVFGLIMSYSMAIGMEIYNNAIQQGVHLRTIFFTVAFSFLVRCTFRIYFY